MRALESQLQSITGLSVASLPPGCGPQQAYEAW